MLVQGVSVSSCCLDWKEAASLRWFSAFLAVIIQLRTSAKTRCLGDGCVAFGPPLAELRVVVLEAIAFMQDAKPSESPQLSLAVVELLAKDGCIPRSAVFTNHLRADPSARVVIGAAIAVFECHADPFVSPACA